MHYPIPLNKQPAVSDKSLELSVGDSVSKDVLSLPIHAYMNNQQIESVVRSLSKAKF